MDSDCGGKATQLSPMSMWLPPLGPKEAADFSPAREGGRFLSLGRAVLQEDLLNLGSPSELWELLGTSGNTEAFLFCFKYDLIFSNY